MNGFIDLNLVVDAVFQLMTDVFSTMLSSWLLCFPLALWLIKKVTTLFRRL